MQPLTERIIAYIQRNTPVTYDALEEVALSKGFTQYEFDTALTQVHKDPRVKTTTIAGDIQYSVAPPKKTPSFFVSTIPYPEMTEKNNGQHEIFAELTYDWLFLTPEELEAYRDTINPWRAIQRRKLSYKQKSSNTSTRKVSSAGGKTITQPTTPSSRCIGLM